MRLRISEMRQAMKMTQSELAERTGISRPYLSLIEKGERNMTVAMQNRIASALGVKPESLVDFSAPANDEVAVIVDAYLNATPEQRQMMMALAKTIAPKA